ncbi:MAG: pyridoxamine 5'-phosphate oxidase family protein [Actinomycetota bacterium]|nr:pyridoxamine 5'-phosphate oxidase family protein [Actinomycetota bacterium]
MKAKIKELLRGQGLAVLATHTRDYPYTSLVAFAAAPDLSYLVFAVGSDSRKYEYLSENKIVSLLIDDRQNYADDFYLASAVTAMGEAGTLDKKDSFNYRLLEARHPQLRDFMAQASTVLIKVTVVTYYLVTHFQEVYQLKF